MAKETTSSGIGFSGALFLVFLVLKLTDRIAWSWWWVTAPLWGVPTLLLGGAAVLALGVVVVAGIRSLWGRFFE